MQTGVLLLPLRLQSLQMQSQSLLMLLLWCLQ
jgi:hypothetical protein